MKLSVITCTGDRPEAFSLCELWMSRQTRQPDEWIVVDDGFEPTLCTRGQTVVRRQAGEPGPLSFANNLQAGIEATTGDTIAFVEDDEHVQSDHLRHVSQLLSTHMAAGCPVQNYYNLPHRCFKIFQNRGASLCQTAIYRGLLPNLKGHIDRNRKLGHFHIDLDFWKEIMNMGISAALPAFPRHVTGMKGLPGRAGLGVGHRPDESWSIDTTGKVLRAWVGDSDAEIYTRLVANVGAPV